MATQGYVINLANLTDKCGSNVDYENPGSSGTSYYFCFPMGNFQVWTGSASSIFQQHPRITFSIWYYTGNPGPNGDSNRMPVVEGRTIDRDTTVTLFHNQTPTTSDYYAVNGIYHLFRLDAIRDRGEGNKTKVLYHPEAISGMSQALYNQHFFGHPIYGISDTQPYLISGRGWSNDVLTHFNLTSMQGQPINSSNASKITTGRWGYGV